MRKPRGFRSIIVVARVISIANQKGGVGKTTTAVNLGASLAADGRRVLIADVDPQGNASSGVGIATATLERGMYDALIGNASLRDIIVPTAMEKLVIAPANRDLAGASLELASIENSHGRLRGLLESVRNEFDYIVIDCPPSLDLLTINGLTASDSVLIPVQCEYYAMEGLSKLIATIELIRDSLNPELEIEGIVFTMYDPRNNLAHQVVNEVKGHFLDKVFETMIPRNIRLSEAPSFGQPCLLYDLASRGSQSYIQLARELVSRRTSHAA
jgi:chromosome partitioning protein